VLLADKLLAFNKLMIMVNRYLNKPV